MKKLLALAAAALLATAAQAECSCQCVNGVVRQLCRSPLDMPAICAPQLCPLVPPSIQPIQMPQLPPLGTQACRQVQVLDPFTRQYRWQTVCQ